MEQEQKNAAAKPQDKGIGWLAGFGMTISVVFTYLSTGKTNCSDMAETACMVGGGFTKGLVFLAIFGLLLFGIGVYRRRKLIDWTGYFMRVMLLGSLPLALYFWLPAFYDDAGKPFAIRLGLAMNIVACVIALVFNWKRKRRQKLVIPALGLVTLGLGFYLFEATDCPEITGPGQTARMCWSDNGLGGKTWHEKLEWNELMQFH